MIMRIPVSGWGMIVRIPALRLGHDRENCWGMLLRNDTPGGLFKDLNNIHVVGNDFRLVQ
jgi:hypothetical protein